MSANGLHQVWNDRRGRAAGLVAAHASGAAASDGKAVVAGRGDAQSIAIGYDYGFRARANPSRVYPARAGLMPISVTPRSSDLMPISGVPEFVTFSAALERQRLSHFNLLARLTL